MRLRRISREELQIIRGLNQDFGADVEKALSGKTILIARERKEVFAVNRMTLKVLRRIKKEPYFAGLHIGEIKRNRFTLALEGASLLAPHAKKKVYVSDEAEQLILYGRDVFQKSILRFERSLKRGDSCLILNKRGEALAIGKFKSDGILVENVIDKGWYLREGG